ncbi:MAG: hypothetical protein AAFO01_01130 [Pseudomonadota bacterium]
MARAEAVCGLTNSSHTALVEGQGVERASLCTLIGEELMIIVARNSGADLSHFHEAIPEPLAVDLGVWPWAAIVLTFLTIW